MSNENKKTEEELLTIIDQEYKILAEYKMVESEKLRGIYVIPSYSNSFLWYGVLFVREGIYTGGIFRFNLTLPDRFPYAETVPIIIFQSDIYHPFVCPYTGSMDISYAFSQWHYGEDHIWQVLKYMQVVFNDPLEVIQSMRDTNEAAAVTNCDCVNPEAAEYLTQNYDDFISKAKISVNLSKERVYDPPPNDDPHYITFEKYNKDIHDLVKQRIRDGYKPNDLSSPKGLSWVKKGEFTPFSAD